MVDGVRLGPGLARRPGVRPRQADLAERPVHPRALDSTQLIERAARLAPHRRVSCGSCCRSCASASSGSTSSSRRPSSSSRAISTTRRCSTRCAEGARRRARRAEALLASSSTLLDARAPFTAATLEERCARSPSKIGWKTKELFMLLRLAVTGRKAVAAAVRDAWPCSARRSCVAACARAAEVLARSSVDCAGTLFALVARRGIASTARPPMRARRAIPARRPHLSAVLIVLVALRR